MEQLLDRGTEVRHRVSTFTFGKRICSSSEAVLVNIPLTDGALMELDAAIVLINIPVLLALDVMQKYVLVVDFERCILQGEDGWKFPLISQLGHVFILPDGPIPNFRIRWTADVL